VSARNVLVTDYQSIDLSDFSVSKIGDKQGLVRLETGDEKQIMQPVAVSRASDIVAIRSLIYEIITGRPPYNELYEDEVERRFKRAEQSMADLRISPHVVEYENAGGSLLT
jgi:hypothetical protein